MCLSAVIPNHCYCIRRSVSRVISSVEMASGSYTETSVHVHECVKLGADSDINFRMLQFKIWGLFFLSIVNRIKWTGSLPERNNYPVKTPRAH
jgi:hypothetical protein